MFRFKCLKKEATIRAIAFVKLIDSDITRYGNLSGRQRIARILLFCSICSGASTGLFAVPTRRCEVDRHGRARWFPMTPAYGMRVLPREDRCYDNRTFNGEAAYVDLEGIGFFRSTMTLDRTAFDLAFVVSVASTQAEAHRHSDPLEPSLRVEGSRAIATIGIDGTPEP